MGTSASRQIRSNRNSAERRRRLNPEEETATATRASNETGDQHPRGGEDQRHDEQRRENHGDRWGGMTVYFHDDSAVRR
jgi:hypothetical protein